MPKFRVSKYQKSDDYIKATIKKYICLRGIEIKELAAGGGMCEATYFNRCRDCSNFTLAELRAFKDVLKIPIEELIPYLL